MNPITDFTFTITSFPKEYIFIFSFLVLLYFLACCSVSLFYFLCRKLQIGEPIEKKPLKENQILKEISWGIITCSIAAMFLYGSFIFIEDIYPTDLNTTLLQIAVFIVIYDFYMYLTHRLLHITRLSKFHAHHHQSVTATPWSCISLHPVEALINNFPFFVFAVVSPVSLSVLLGIYSYLIFGIANGHSNYNLIAKSTRFPLLQELSCFHQRHHSSGKANFGFLFTHWDVVFGTRHKKYEQT